jgi:hypothetical protein
MFFQKRPKSSQFVAASSQDKCVTISLNGAAFSKVTICETLPTLTYDQSFTLLANRVTR